MRPNGAWRLSAAAAICVVSLGLAWGSALDFGLQMGLTLPTSYVGVDGYLQTSVSTPYWYYGADGIEVLPGSRSDVRAVLVPAALILGWAAVHRTDLTRRLTRGAGFALVGLFLVACSRGMTAAAVSMVAASWLVAPVVWPSWSRRLAYRPGRGGQPPVAAATDPGGHGSAF